MGGSPCDRGRSIRAVREQRADHVLVPLLGLHANHHSPR